MNKYDDVFVDDNNLKNLSFKTLLSIHRLRDDQEIIDIFEAGGIFEVSKSKIKAWKTDPLANYRGQVMPNAVFWGFMRGLKAWQLMGRLKNNPYLEENEKGDL